MKAMHAIKPTITKSKLMLCAEKMADVPVLGIVVALLAWRFGYVDAVYGQIGVRVYLREQWSCTILLFGHSHTFESF